MPSVERQAEQRYLFDDAWARAQTKAELEILVRAIDGGVTDERRLTDLVFYERHPDMTGVPLTKERQDLLDEWNAISTSLVHPALSEIEAILAAPTDASSASGDARAAGVALVRAEPLDATSIPFGVANPKAIGGDPRLGGVMGEKLDALVVRAAESCPGLSPSILKSLLAQESNFDPTVINKYGYAGIAQFGRAAAREVGLSVGVAGSHTDERLNPYKAVPAAARLLNIKAQRLSESAFARYGRPTGTEFWKFVVAAYNGGEGTVGLAMGHAYRSGLAHAAARAMTGTEAVAYARHHATRWENLKAGGYDSPLGLAAARFFPRLASAKYHEIGNYPTQIMARARQMRL